MFCRDLLFYLASNPSGLAANETEAAVSMFCFKFGTKSGYMYKNINNFKEYLPTVHSPSWHVNYM